MKKADMETLEELVFGYDRTPNGLIVNQAEATVVRYIYDRRIELASNPPEDLINEVIDEYAERGETLSVEEAKKKIPSYKLLQLIEEEVKTMWPAEYESLLRKQSHNRTSLDRKMSSNRTFTNCKGQCEPIISRGEWDKLQSQITLDQNDN